jgi:hypothetical protein
MTPDALKAWLREPFDRDPLRLLGALWVFLAAKDGSPSRSEHARCGWGGCIYPAGHTGDHRALTGGAT